MPSLEVGDRLMTFRRSELFQWIGQWALPPWTDDAGEMLGANIDCARLSGRLIDTIDGIEVHAPDLPPNLGCASTRQLLVELAARSRDIGPDGTAWLDYRTVGEYPEGAFAAPEAVL